MAEELRDLRLMRLLIDVVGGESHVVSLGQIELWLECMARLPITTRAGRVVQLTKDQKPGCDPVYYLCGRNP